MVLLRKVYRLGETLYLEGLAHSWMMAVVGVTVLITLFLCLPPLRAEMGAGAGAALRPRVTRCCSRSGQLAPGTEMVGKCLLN